MGKIIKGYCPVFFIVLFAGCAESTSPEDMFVEPDPAENPEPLLDPEPVPETAEALPDLQDGSDSSDPVEDEQGPGSPIGGPCESDGDCIAPEGTAPVCLTDVVVIQFPGGYCSATCPGAGSCGPDAECIDLMLVKYCVRQCSSTAECRVDEGYVCDIIPVIDEINTYCIPLT
jgi:hypothetical protein